MIPQSEEILTEAESARWNLTKLAGALVLEGIPADQVMLDCREGIDHAKQMLVRRSRT